MHDHFHFLLHLRVTHVQDTKTLELPPMASSSDKSVANAALFTSLQQLSAISAVTTMDKNYIVVYGGNFFLATGHNACKARQQC